MKIQLTVMILLIGGAATVYASRLQNCDQVGELARVIAEKRDAGVDAHVLREELNRMSTDNESKSAADILITEIYSTESRDLSPDDIAAKVMEGCLGSGHD